MWELDEKWYGYVSEGIERPGLTEETELTRLTKLHVGRVLLPLQPLSKSRHFDTLIHVNGLHSTYYLSSCTISDYC